MRTSAFALALIGTLAARSALAEPSSGEFVDRGIQLRRQHRDAEALEQFKRADQLNPAPRIRAQIGLAEQALGQWLEAERDLNLALSANQDPWIAEREQGLRKALAAIQQHLGSLTVIATPVDCTAPGGMSRVLAIPAMKPVLALDADGCVPGAAIREAFHLLSPRALRSVLYGLKVRRDPVAWYGYSALARWVWEQRKLGGALFFDTVRMVRDNTVVTVLSNGRSGAERRRRERGQNPLPLLACVAERDHIVPPAMTLAITGIEGIDVEVLQCRGGHVSMLSGSRAGRSLWSDLAAWLRSHGAGAPGLELTGTAPARRRRRSALGEVHLH